MSFLSERKAEIIEQRYKNQCCRRALLLGILFSRGEKCDKGISVKLENTEIAEFVATSINEIYGSLATISTPECGGRGRVLCFQSTSCEKYLDSLAHGGDIITSKCPTCIAAFLRGVFLACARISEPSKQYRLEFAPRLNHQSLCDILLENGMSFKICTRRKEKILYTENGGVIQDFFGFVGMNKTYFILVDRAIESDIINSTIRQTNCETNNIMKSVNASKRHREAILALERANLLSSLPEELEKTARLRLQYPDYSLARLASMFSPAISKPGLSHRLNKIVEIAERLLGNNK